MSFWNSTKVWEKIFLIAWILLLGMEGTAQEQRFKAAVLLGLNASQLNGDRSAGYNKLGPTGGLRGVVVLGDKWNLSVELLYGQRGSRYPTGLNNPTPGAPLNITTSYIDVPVVISLGDWLSEDETYYRIEVHGGLAFGRLFNAIARDSPYDDNTDLFEKNDLNLVVGASYFVNAHFAFTFRYNRSVLLLYNNSKHPNFNANSLFSHFLTLRAEYLF